MLDKRADSNTSGTTESGIEGGTDMQVGDPSENLPF
jgi:hypothetical protein